MIPAVIEVRKPEKDWPLQCAICGGNDQLQVVWSDGRIGWTCAQLPPIEIGMTDDDIKERLYVYFPDK
jgi:hypothetical protein